MYFERFEGSAFDPRRSPEGGAVGKRTRRGKSTRGREGSEGLSSERGEGRREADEASILAYSGLGIRRSGEAGTCPFPCIAGR